MISGVICGGAWRSGESLMVWREKEAETGCLQREKLVRGPQGCSQGHAVLLATPFCQVPLSCLSPQSVSWFGRFPPPVILTLLPPKKPTPTSSKTLKIPHPRI